MIDIENMVIDKVYKAVIAQYPTANVTSEFTDTPSKFPCVAIYEGDNSTYTKSQDNELREHHAFVMYEVQVFSNKTSGRKSEAKKILKIVDDTLQDIKFTRTFMNPIPNQDKSIYRYIARYEAVVGQGIAKGNDTIYPMYRR